jgi:DNA-binding NtrC family response regulator
VSIDIPPLRERREDIPVLVEFLLARQARSMGKRFTGVSHQTMQILLACEWKGNIRELDNALQRAVIFGEGPLVLPDDLPPDLRPIPDDPGLVDDLIEATRRFERRHIERVLRQAGDKREAARRMNVSLSSLYRKIEQLEIQTKDEPAAKASY